MHIRIGTRGSRLARWQAEWVAEKLCTRKIEVELITPVAMEAGLRFAIREGGRTVGAGVVGEILD